ncbi:REP-associated tyrosine transposase [Salipiger abyssi]|uniref:REP-associated tyrosine transposase n=1 Tax=Salipiger abyssi TaxID=1250539 RepID=UPI001A8C4BA6|nr:transposase [Salipiger abyssi]MBN9886884.1 transposase [Salipiger abyssi]
MSLYRRPNITGATVFFTVCLAQRGGALLIDEIEVLRDAVKVTRARRPFGIDAWVVLPDHMHAVWTLPGDDSKYYDRWGAIKARFSKFVRLKAARTDESTARPTHNALADELERLRVARSPSKIGKQDAGIWQRRFWEHHIRSEADYAAHVRYCLTNPVKHGLVETPEAWPYSSVHREIREGRWP